MRLRMWSIRLCCLCPHMPAFWPAFSSRYEPHFFPICPKPLKKPANLHRNGAYAEDFSVYAPLLRYLRLPLRVFSHIATAGTMELFQAVTRWIDMVKLVFQNCVTFCTLLCRCAGSCCARRMTNWSADYNAAAGAGNVCSTSACF